MSIPQLTPPKCPHCKADLPEIGCYGWKMGPFTILANHCPHCLVALHFQIFQQQPAAAEPGEPGEPTSPIWKPS